MENRWGRACVRVLEIVIVVCLAVMAVLVFGNVVLRYGFDSSIAFSEELARLMFVWLIFLGAILASIQHAHIGFDALVQRLPVAGRKFAVLLTGGLMLWACGMFLVGGWKQTKINLGNTYPVLGVSYGWLYGVALVFGTGMAIAIATNIWRALRSPDGLVLTQDLADRIEEKVPDVAAADTRAAMVRADDGGGASTMGLKEGNKGDAE
jgi:TRAP-type C4-dicarboxylate transport system permease small subunit